MNQQRTSLEHTNLETELSVQAPRQGKDEIIITGIPLSTAQQQTKHELLQLFYSLCGRQPGQYWPQALFETAGHLNRPSFPFSNRPNTKE